MDEIEIFKYPMLFQTYLRGTDTTINLVPHVYRLTSYVLDKQGNETPRIQFMGDALASLPEILIVLKTTTVRVSKAVK